MNRYQTVKPEQKYTAKMFEREFPTEDCLPRVRQREALPRRNRPLRQLQGGAEALPRLRPHLLRLPRLRQPHLPPRRHHLP